MQRPIHDPALPAAPQRDLSIPVRQRTSATSCDP